MGFLQLEHQAVLIFGVANRKSVAYAIAQTIEQAGGECVYVVKSEEIRRANAKLFGDSEVYVCDVRRDDEIERLRDKLLGMHHQFQGMVHSIAAADYSDGIKPFHETSRKQFLDAVDVSCYSLIALSNAMKDVLAPNGSVVTISISTTRMASESYGYMAPIKAALDSSLAFLAKSFSRFSEIRFNAVAPGLLKTSASAGIPGYVDAYLFAEQVIPRKKALKNDEVANVAAFLLSPRSRGINAQTVVVDAGMAINYFDQDLVRRAMRPEEDEENGN